ncbi:MAG: LytTR family DNA-binding domain-containing protein [Actinomycetota bacterium]|nr:LytTR family DNA-binding domain-containing protein [Actinomycetota bacterium]
MTLRALIVDDEAPARSDLRHLLRRHPEIEVVGEAAGAREALQLATAVRYDIVFCDIELADASGLEIAKLVRERPGNPTLVFVTAYERYAVAAFAVEAFDYLLKPVDPARLARVVSRLQDARQTTASEVSRVSVVSGDKTVLLEQDAIHFVRADGDYTRVHTYDRSHLCTSPLHELEEKLPSKRFLRIHRSYLVNLANVASVRRTAAGQLRLVLADANATELEVARRQAKTVREALRR